MACCLSGAKPLSEPMLNYCQLDPCEHFQWNLNHNATIFIDENARENVVCEMASILSRPQCVKACFSQRPFGYRPLHRVLDVHATLFKTSDDVSIELFQELNSRACIIITLRNGMIGLTRCISGCQSVTMEKICTSWPSCQRVRPSVSQSVRVIRIV